MRRKVNKITEDATMTVSEPVVDYDTRVADVSSSEKWNPNVPFHCTQEEFLQHIHSIEQGNFTPWEAAKREHQQWKKKFLASRL